MSRARKVKKAGRYFEYEMTDRFGEVVVWYGGPWEAHARRSRMRDKRRLGMGHFRPAVPAPVKRRR